MLHDVDRINKGKTVDLGQFLPRDRQDGRRDSLWLGVFQDKLLQSMKMGKLPGNGLERGNLNTLASKLTCQEQHASADFQHAITGA